MRAVCPEDIFTVQQGKQVPEKTYHCNQQQASNHPWLGKSTDHEPNKGGQRKYDASAPDGGTVVRAAFVGLVGDIVPFSYAEVKEYGSCKDDEGNKIVRHGVFTLQNLL